MTKRTEVVVHEGHLAPITVATLQARVGLVHKALTTVMKEGTHYGTIPGTSKPTLYKAGSEILLTMFQIAVEPEVEDLSTSDVAHYRIRALGRHQGTGTLVGTGIGEASSNEEKYKWREAVCREEWEATPEDQRRLKWRRGRDGADATATHQVRVNHADVCNTVLKMAKKRAQIDLSLTATGASDIFTQDVVDDPEDGGSAGKPPVARPTAVASPTELASTKQLNLIAMRAKKAGLSEQEVAAAAGYDDLAKLPWRLVDTSLAWINANAKPAP